MSDHRPSLHRIEDILVAIFGRGVCTYALPWLCLPDHDGFARIFASSHALCEISQLEDGPLLEGRTCVRSSIQLQVVSISLVASSVVYVRCCVRTLDPINSHRKREGNLDLDLLGVW